MKSLQYCTKVRRPTAAVAGRASGIAMCAQIRRAPMPSSRAASNSAGGTAAERPVEDQDEERARSHRHRRQQREQAVDQAELPEHEEAGEPERGERNHAHHNRESEQAVAGRGGSWAIANPAHDATSTVSGMARPATRSEFAR